MKSDLKARSTVLPTRARYDGRAHEGQVFQEGTHIPGQYELVDVALN